MWLMLEMFLALSLYFFSADLWLIDCGFFIVNNIKCIIFYYRLNIIVSYYNNNYYNVIRLQKSKYNITLTKKFLRSPLLLAWLLVISFVTVFSLSIQTLNIYDLYFFSQDKIF